MARKSKFAPPTRHAELGEYSGVVPGSETREAQIHLPDLAPFRTRMSSNTTLAKTRLLLKRSTGLIIKRLRIV
jgi:hypothetical protein